MHRLPDLPGRLSGSAKCNPYASNPKKTRSNMSQDNSTVEQDQPKLADLHEAILDAATLERLFQDLAFCTEIIEIIPRYARHLLVAEQTVSLDQARELLLSGEARGVQIRYRYEGAQWWDTLMRTPEGVRIVRIRHEF
jgi:hypothetical protein